MIIETLNESHYKPLYEIAMKAEPYASNILFEQFISAMKLREGYVVATTNNIPVGCISFSDFVPTVNILIHCVVDEKYQRRWVNRKMLETMGTYIFSQLNLPRVSGYCVKGLSDKAGWFLLNLGFKYEGTIRKGFRTPAGLYDLMLFGMLKEECLWI